MAVNALAVCSRACVVELLIFVHAAQKKNFALYAVGAFPGAMPPLIGWAAASGRLSRRRGCSRHALPLAIPALHGHCLVVSRGLRPGGLPVLLVEGEGIVSLPWLERAPGPCLIPLSLYPRVPRQCRSCLPVELCSGSYFFYCAAPIGLSPFGTLLRVSCFSRRSYIFHSCSF